MRLRARAPAAVRSLLPHGGHPPSHTQPLPPFYSGVNPAVWEITGHMVLFRAADYETFTQDLAWELLAAISLSEERFAQVAAMCFGGGGSNGAAAGAAACEAAPALA